MNWFRHLTLNPSPRSRRRGRTIFYLLSAIFVLVALSAQAQRAGSTPGAGSVPGGGTTVVGGGATNGIQMLNGVGTNTTIRILNGTGTNVFNVIQLPQKFQTATDVEQWTMEYGPVFPFPTPSDNGVYWTGP